ncbi:MAG TPA: M20/M25/M40 family metallo-hydrolase [Gaiellaceae bacterium]
MPTPDLLTALLAAPGPSGHEEEPARIWREAAAAFAEVTSDTLGTSFARVRSGDGDAHTLALVGHIDEVGVAVTHIAENGLLSFVTLGGAAAETLIGQRLELLTRNGRIPGAVARKRLAPAELRNRPKTEHADLHIDIGATSREDAERLVRMGDAGVWIGAPVELPNGRLLSSSLDNRLGAYIVLEVARRVAEAKAARIDVVAVASVQEEIGSYGARTAAYELAPQVAIAVDVTPATDYPGGEARRSGAVELGMGALISRGPTLNKKVVDLLVEVAEAEGIAHAFEAYSRTTETDADEMHLVRSGIPTALISIPLRYMHTPNELCDLDDVESIVRLLVAFAARLEPSDSFVR